MTSVTYRPPDVRGWSWKQVVLASATAIASGLKEIADAIAKTGKKEQ